ncbi:class I SAM-dependent methyltransferase (plasmid) [Sinorhizobium numidicum]|uniref:Class I SAM-dependent methyltransferase n=1 Tax=Sinorhizobium numidicum TaxID=680248 RepID=A0ABY8D335_9HYPH|nr:class I SAM-dependent methyltransferase [Sinorhizobium numidicum]WEX79324.1 class I SAM-dependent methyltransferase [Sinorhizobium numidicum]WEX85305.1 class I SAM-dependent methyltransferase [Sinorhizobium numidicum]
MTLPKAFGDFSAVAQQYLLRPRYSPTLMSHLINDVQREYPEALFADIGAGTGAIAWTLVENGLSGFAVEPDSEMIRAGQRSDEGSASLEWLKGTGEGTGLPDESIDWVLYGSSFHWTDFRGAISETLRILRPGGFITILYLLTDLEHDPIHIEIENIIRATAPGLRRARAPVMALIPSLEPALIECQGLEPPIQLRSSQKIPMTAELYYNYWRTSHDIPSQLGQADWEDLLAKIRDTYLRRSPESIRFQTLAWHSRKR